MNFIIGGLSVKGVTNLSILPYNSSRLRSISFNIFRIQDSLAHLPASLQSLMDNLKASGHQFKILQQSALMKIEDGEIDEKRVEMSKSKGFYPYSFATSIEK